jgi:hypothetical protein
MPPADYWEDEWYDDRQFTGGARHVRAPSARRSRDDDFARRTSEFLLAPEGRTTTSLHRTRSQGHAPAPNVTIYNTTRNDNESNPNVRTEQKSPSVNPYAEPRGRTRKMPGEWGVEDQIAELRIDIAKQGRSRSRSGHGHHRDDHHAHDIDHWKLEQANQRIREQEERIEMERREELIKRKMELKYMKDRHEREEEEERIKRDEDRLKREWELKHEREERKRIEREEDAKRQEDRLKKDWELRLERETRKKEEERRAEELERKRLIDESMAKADRRAREQDEERQRIVAESVAKAERRAREQEEERQRIIAENTLKLEKAERERKAAQQRAVDDYNKERDEKEAKAKAEQERVVAQYEAKKVKDATEAQRKREELIMQLRIEEEHRKQKEKEEWDRFLLKQKQKEEEEKAAKEKQEKELEEAMRKRLAHFGFQDNQIQAMIKPEEAARLQQGMSPANPLRLAPQPTYVKVSKEHLAIDTLVYYDIPYEVDRVSLTTFSSFPDSDHVIGRPQLHHHHARDGTSRNGDSLRAHPASALSRKQSSSHRRAHRPWKERLRLGSPKEAFSIPVASSKLTEEGCRDQGNVLLKRQHGILGI